MLAMGGRAPEFRPLPDQDEQSVSLSTLLRPRPADPVFFYPADCHSGVHAARPARIRDLTAEIQEAGLDVAA